MTEKILARASGRSFVRAGDAIEARPDFVISYDFPGYTDVFFREAREDFGSQPRILEWTASMSVHADGRKDLNFSAFGEAIDVGPHPRIGVDRM